jgi:iron complex outermembrane receptor protein
METDDGRSASRHPFTAQAQTAQASGEGQSAEAASDAGTNDIIVTARRTNERLQDVPVAVTAFGSDALAARNVDTLDQVARFTPNIRFDGAAALSGGNYNATVFIRGVGQNDFAIFSDPASASMSTTCTTPARSAA